MQAQGFVSKRYRALPAIARHMEHYGINTHCKIVSIFYNAIVGVDIVSGIWIMVGSPLFLILILF